jgi:singapore isolate B (sub-type 7) whole genome shotgun sequence assembly, scaffold_2
MTQNKKYLLRKIGKRVCHVAMTVSTFTVAATTVVSADEVVAPTDNNVTTTTEAPATPVTETPVTPVTETPTTAAPTSETPAANPVTDVAPATTAAPTMEAPVTEAPTTATPATEAPTTAAPVTKAEKSTNIDELLRPETNQSAQITVTTQLHRDMPTDHSSAPIGEPKVEKASTTRSNADGRAEAMIVDSVNKIQQSNNGNALEIDGGNYKVSTYNVNRESKTVDGVQVLNYTVNVYTKHFEGNIDRRLHSYDLIVKGDKGETIETKSKVEEGEAGLNTDEVRDDQVKYALGSIVENGGKSYRVVYHEETLAKIDSIDDNPDKEHINYELEIRLKEIAKYPTEIIMFQINDDKGNVLRGPRRAEIVAGRAESIFNIGDKIVEGGKNYVVAGRSMSHSKEDLPTGEVQTFLYKITLKEDVPNATEQKSNVKVVTNDGTTLLDYNPVTEGGKTGSEYRVKDEITVEGKKYVVTNIEGTVSRNRNEANTADVEASNTVVTVREVSTKPAQYVATVDYVVGGEIIKQAVVLNGSADNKDQADAQLNSQSNLMQAMLGKEFEMGGKKYKIKEIRDIQRENFDDEDKVRLSLKMVYDLEEVPKASEQPEEYPKAEAPGNETEKPSTDAEKPNEEKPSDDVKPSEDAPKPSEEKPSEDVKPSEEAPKPSNDVKPNQEAPKEDKKAPSSEVKQEKVAPKNEEKQLPNTGVESLIGSLGAGLAALLGGLGLAIKKDHDK